MITAKMDDKEVQKLMKELYRRSNNLKPFFAVAKTVLDTSVVKTFRAQGRPDRWTALSPLTKAIRQAEGTLKGAAILNRYGTLRQSIGTEILEIGRKQMRYGTRQVKAALLHFGGTIRPKKGKYLTIPLPGVTGRARDYDNTFIPKGKRVMFQNLGDGNIRPLFLLKTSVTIPGRPFLMFQDEDVDVLCKYLLVFVSDGKAYTGLLKGGK